MGRSRARMSDQSMAREGVAMEEIECRMRGRKKPFLQTGIMAGKVGVTGENDDVLSSAKGPELP